MSRESGPISRSSGGKSGDFVSKECSQHGAFIRLLIAYLVFRGLAIPFLQPGGFLVAASPDQFFYHEIGRLAGSGQYPYLDYWMEFPPLFPWLIVAAYKMSLLIAPPGNSIFWFNTILRGMLLPFEAGSLALVYAVAGRLYGREESLSAVQSYALLFGSLFAFLGWFDSLVTFFILLALYGLVV